MWYKSLSGWRLSLDFGFLLERSYICLSVISFVIVQFTYVTDVANNWSMRNSFSPWTLQRKQTTLLVEWLGESDLWPSQHKHVPGAVQCFLSRSLSVSLFDCQLFWLIIWLHYTNEFGWSSLCELNYLSWQALHFCFRCLVSVVDTKDYIETH